MSENKKRRGGSPSAEPSHKKHKIVMKYIPFANSSAKIAKLQGKKQWQVPRRNADASRAIEPGDVGIWASCVMGKEGKCAAELKDFFEEYALGLYGEAQIKGLKETTENDEDDETSEDIESAIKKELEAIQKPSTNDLFQHVRLDTECVIFFRTRAPVEPVTFVHSLCKDIASGSQRVQSRFVKRLTPITLSGKATDKGLEETAKQVLAPHFHQPNEAQKKFAIRPTFRNHKNLTRDGVIRAVASMVGLKHKVDLKGYDRLVLVDIYQNICGISVVGSDYEELKRYNLAELAENSDGAKAEE